MIRTNSAQNPRLLEALWCAKQGWAVVPCHPGEKRPMTQHGYKDASTNKSRIIQWWSDAPDANLAVVTGALSGVIVPDIDPRNGGDESLAELERKYGPLPPTLMVITGGGGRHFYFAHPQGIAARSSTLAPGIDLQADGKLVIAPPSVHPSGKLYQWADRNVPLAPCPKWLLAATSASRIAAPDAADSLLGKAFARQGLLGRLMDGGKRAVVCPWVDQHTERKPLDIDSSTVIFPATAPSQLGAFHCIHSHCSERKGPEALRELERREALGDSQRAWQAGLRRSAKGELRSTFGNAVLILTHDDSYADRLRMDEMRGRVEQDEEEATDESVGNIRVDLEVRYSLLISDAEAARALQLVASRNGYHPVREQLESLSWDGVPRIRQVASSILGARAEDATEASYYSTVVYRWFISLVARAFSPGCKVDTALILQGEQGVGKSSFFRKLAGDWFSDTEMGLDKDALLQMRSTWIYEWAELENVTSRHAMSRVKAFLTSNEDRFRPPFGRAMITVKRSGVIVGTTNREEFLHDPSGSRRFWVVPVGEIDLAQLQVDRDQLLAEAVHLFRLSERWWLSPEEEAQRADTSSRFVEVDPWEAQVLAYAKQQNIVRTADILRDVLEMALERRDRKAEMRIAAILRRNGYFPDQRRVDGEKCRFWLRQKPSGRLGQPLQVSEMPGRPNPSKRDR